MFRLDAQLLIRENAGRHIPSRRDFAFCPSGEGYAACSPRPSLLRLYPHPQPPSNANEHEASLQEAARADGGDRGRWLLVAEAFDADEEEQGG